MSSTKKLSGHFGKILTVTNDKNRQSWVVLLIHRFILLSLCFQNMIESVDHDSLKPQK